MIFIVFWCPGGFPGRPKGKKIDVQGLHMAAQGLQMHHIDVHAVYGCWLAGHQDPRIQATRSCGGNEPVLGAHSTIQNGGYSIQNTVKKHAAYSIQKYKDTKMQDTRMQRIQDAGTKMQRIQDGGSKQPFAAWWPLYRGAGGLNL